MWSSSLCASLTRNLHSTLHLLVGLPARRRARQLGGAAWLGRDRRLQGRVTRMLIHLRTPEIMEDICSWICLLDKQLRTDLLDTFVQTQSPTSGSLCQVWLPETTSHGSVVLKSKGLPFCVAGIGDFLALFRCISCRYCFGTDVQKPELLGAPGRVFTTLTPEMSQNVQQYSKSVYLRASEAQQCKVQSTLVVPLFDGNDHHQPCGVLEVVQAVQDMSFDNVMQTLASVLQLYGLSTSDQSISSGEMQERSEEVKTLAAGSSIAQQEADSNPEVAPMPAGHIPAAAVADQDMEDSTMLDDDGSDIGDDEDDMLDDSGKRLQLQDLQVQFGVGLREAAKRLGICPTTLKRACRRHGIQRWPRRQLVKLSKAIDQIQATGSAGRQLPMPGPETMDLGQSDGQVGSLVPAPDMRWTTLARLVPAISMHQQGTVEDKPPMFSLSPEKMSNEVLKHEASGSQNDSNHQGVMMDRSQSVSNLASRSGTSPGLPTSAIPIINAPGQQLAGQQDSPSGLGVLQSAVAGVPTSHQGLQPLTEPFLVSAPNTQMYAGGVVDQVPSAQSLPVLAATPMPSQAFSWPGVSHLQQSSMIPVTQSSHGISTSLPSSATLPQIEFGQSGSNAQPQHDPAWTIPSAPPGKALASQPLGLPPAFVSGGLAGVNDDLGGLSFDIEEDVGLFDPEVLEMMLAQSS
ncbi:hypothetical protein WJX84_003456 [Apatococcus fuscideae]|uniref:RWP-RK domain-containing protein n=1 Tax=Apatococcus fuscideae TaxID=2026836 RepID=A0AAW1TJ52_9CHLO